MTRLQLEICGSDSNSLKGNGEKSRQKKSRKLLLISLFCYAGVKVGSWVGR